MRLVTVRHPPVHVSGLCYGQHDLPATATVAEVAVLASDVEGVTSVWTSPLVRSAALAARLAEVLGVPLERDADLSEMSFGQWEGRLWSDIESEDGERLGRWMRDWQRETPPGGEALASFEARVRRAVGRIERQGDALPLLVTHAGVVRALRVILEHAAWDEAMAEPVPHLAPRRLSGTARTPAARDKGWQE